MPQVSQREPTIVLLLTAHVVAVAVVPWLIFAVDAGVVRPFCVVLGIYQGQCVWLAFWFSLSQWRLRYRIAALLLVLPTAILVFQRLVFAPRWSFLRMPRQVFVDVFAAQQPWEALVGHTGACLALVLTIYVVLLPVRRLVGISLGVHAGDALPPSRQFRIIDWMIWTGVFALSGGILRWATSHEQFVLFLSLGGIAIPASLLIGAAFFFASLWGYRSVLFMPLALAVVLITAWLVLDRPQRVPGLAKTGPSIDFRMAAAAAIGWWAAIGASNLALQAAGIGLRAAPRSR